jgi:hypothetical protein
VHIFNQNFQTQNNTPGLGDRQRGNVNINSDNDSQASLQTGENRTLSDFPDVYVPENASDEELNDIVDSLVGEGKLNRNFDERSLDGVGRNPAGFKFAILSEYGEKNAGKISKIIKDRKSGKDTRAEAEKLAAKGGESEENQDSNFTTLQDFAGDRALTEGVKHMSDEQAFSPGMMKKFKERFAPFALAQHEHRMAKQFLNKFFRNRKTDSHMAEVMRSKKEEINEKFEKEEEEKANLKNPQNPEKTKDINDSKKINRTPETDSQKTTRSNTGTNDTNNTQEQSAQNSNKTANTAKHNNEAQNKEVKNADIEFIEELAGDPHFEKETDFHRLASTFLSSYDDMKMYGGILIDNIPEQLLRGVVVETPQRVSFDV